MNYCPRCSCRYPTAPPEHLCPRCGGPTRELALHAPDEPGRRPDVRPEALEPFPLPPHVTQQKHRHDQ